MSSDGNQPQPVVSTQSRVAAVGPYIQSATMPRIASRNELLVKPAFPDGIPAVQVPDGPLKTQTLPNMRAGALSQIKAPGGNYHCSFRFLLPTNVDFLVQLHNQEYLLIGREMMYTSFVFTVVYNKSIYGIISWLLTTVFQ